MNPKDKALEIIANMITETIGKPTLTNDQAKICAIVAVELLIEQAEMTDDDVGYWQECINEIKSV